ncbi:protein FAM107B [Astyanax mexicanus]|uniref:Protein FAM107B-like n=2 Tax=Astyanax mexicanus TaxID=7994 RepID=A0A8T2KLG5_ASTMX|nr:protein FAM107B [Astyanax mexicanus]KAG9260550.1 protein FAM107B-like [Astyanax mexicanus]
MLLYYTTQVMPSGNVRNRDHREENSISEGPVHQQTTDSEDDLVLPKKQSNPMLESPSHRGLHRELLLSHRWGLLPSEKSELKKVMEQRRLEQHREREQALQALTDLQQELHKRRQRLMAYEREEQKRQEDLKNTPEFVRVRDNLRRVRVLGN